MHCVGSPLCPRAEFKIFGNLPAEYSAAARDQQLSGFFSRRGCFYRMAKAQRRGGQLWARAPISAINAECRPVCVISKVIPLITAF